MKPLINVDDRETPSARILFYATSPYIPLLLGVLMFVTMLLCPPYKMVHIHDDKMQPCTGYTFVRSLPPPHTIAGGILMGSQYYGELGFLLFWTGLSVAKTLIWQRKKPQSAKAVIPFLCVWGLLVFLYTAFAAAIPMAPGHQIVACESSEE